MKEIKFRQYLNNKGEKKHPIWHYFDLQTHSCNPFEYPTICQFTGLKDTHNQDIYEGDVVANDTREIIGVVKWVDDELSDVNKENAMFGIWDEINKEWFWFADHYPPKYLNVVGNIYENGDLLK